VKLNQERRTRWKWSGFPSGWWIFLASVIHTTIECPEVLGNLPIGQVLTSEIVEIDVPQLLFGVGAADPKAGKAVKASRPQVKIYVLALLRNCHGRVAHERTGAGE
jgi:hypothetical protein